MKGRACSLLDRKCSSVACSSCTEDEDDLQPRKGKRSGDRARPASGRSAFPSCFSSAPPAAVFPPKEREAGTASCRRGFPARHALPEVTSPTGHDVMHRSSSLRHQHLTPHMATLSLSWLSLA